MGIEVVDVRDVEMEEEQKDGVVVIQEIPEANPEVANAIYAVKLTVRIKMAQLKLMLHQQNGLGVGQREPSIHSKNTFTWISFQAN
jgi:hypothetical protein